MSTNLTQSTTAPAPAPAEEPSPAKDLPKDIIIDILSRLPVRSLVQFYCVCKSWYALRLNPNFISKHFRHSTLSTANHGDRSFFLLTRHQSKAITLLSGTKSVDIPINMDIPFLNISKPLRISGSCHGLVCLSVMPIASILIIWNPATRVFKDLPVSNVQRPNAGPIKVVLGFGFDSGSKDYKVLRIVNYCYPLNQVEIYSLGTDTWREIEANVRFIIFEASSRVFVRGRFHWTALGFRELNGRELIVTFDLGEEVFSQFMLPNFSRENDDNDGDDDDDDDEEDEGRLGWHLVAWKDSIGLIVYPNHSKDKKFDMWVMNEYGVAGSWTKYMSFGPYPRVNKPLGCRMNGEVLLHKENGELVLYDPATQEFKNVPVNDVPYCSEVFNHVESLVPIKGGKDLEEANMYTVVPDLFFVRKIDLLLE
ncbi:F-box protein At3g07870-like [Rhododendron vialii]|uniref:F-box protein At3g07870-like n=1 Tax=Rhododendron vialii TaxID=182163 RepID=UPI00265E991C|nr:F-box protein At3g07870-like [Rhododendron vialii]